jgi:hypothetical protein
VLSCIRSNINFAKKLKKLFFLIKAIFVFRLNPIFLREEQEEICKHENFPHNAHSEFIFRL